MNRSELESKARYALMVLHPNYDKMGTYEREDWLRHIVAYYSWIEQL